MWHWLISRNPFFNLGSFCVENSNTVDELAICRIFTQNSWLQPFPISLKCSILQLSWSPSIVYPPPQMSIMDRMNIWISLWREPWHQRLCDSGQQCHDLVKNTGTEEISHCTQQCKNTLRDTWKKNHQETNFYSLEYLSYSWNFLTW